MDKKDEKRTEGRESESERAETYGAMASAMLHVHMLGLVGSQFILCPEAKHNHV